MIALLLSVAVQVAPAPTPAQGPVPLGPIGKQTLPARGCAAYLWSVADRQLVAMAGADPARLRIAIDGKTLDYARASQNGAGGYGFGKVNVYSGADITATLDMTVVERPELTSGAMIPDATIRIDRTGRDTVIVPVAGLVGCAAVTP